MSNLPCQDTRSYVEFGLRWMRYLSANIDASAGPAKNSNKRVGSVNQYENARASSRLMFPTDSVSIHCTFVKDIGKRIIPLLSLLYLQGLRRSGTSDGRIHLEATATGKRHVRYTCTLKHTSTHAYTMVIVICELTVKCSQLNQQELKIKSLLHVFQGVPDFCVCRSLHIQNNLNVALLIRSTLMLIDPF